MTPPTPISPQMQELLKENERLKAELAQKKPKRLILTARAFLSKTHDFEAYLSFYKKNAQGELVKDEKTGFYVLDQDMKRLYWNTAANRAFLDGKMRYFDIYEEEE